MNRPSSQPFGYTSVNGYRNQNANRDNSPLSEQIATTVVTLQSEVDDSPRSFRVTSLATEHREVKVVVITAVSATVQNLSVFVREAKAL